MMAFDNLPGDIGEMFEGHRDGHLQLNKMYEALLAVK